MAKHFAIFGNPVHHSISPLMHNLALRGLGIEGCYSRYLLEDEALLREKFFSLGLDGINITVPHKEAAFLACDTIEGVAKEIGAINTIVRHKDQLIGYNTDAPGFYRMAKQMGEIKSVLILGAGGTAKALAAIFRQEDVDVTILNRSKNRLAFFQKKGFACMDWESYRASTYDLVVNTTSAGLEDDSLPLPKTMMKEIFIHTKYAIDVIYNRQTPFLILAKEYRIPTQDGSKMLLYQGSLALELFLKHQYTPKELEFFMKKAFD